MSCQRVRAELQWLPEEAMAEARALEEHARECPSCARELAELRGVSRLLAVPVMPADPYFLTRFRARREASEAASFDAWRRLVVRWLLPLTSATAIVAVLLISGGERKGEAFHDLERQALATGAPEIRHVADGIDAEPLVAFALTPRETTRVVRDR